MKVGDVFNFNFDVNKAVYDGFKNTFKDLNPLHCNVDYAISKGFKDRVMYGNILNGFLSYFIGELLPIKNVIIHSQDIQFKNPVYLEDQLKFESIVHDFSGAVSVYEFKYKFINSDQKIVAKGKIRIGAI